MEKLNKLNYSKISAHQKKLIEWKSIPQNARRYLQYIYLMKGL